MSRKLSAVTALFAMVLASLSLLLTSCTRDDTVRPDTSQRIESLTVSSGELHNEILTAYAEGKNLFLDKLSREEATRLFIESANKVLENRGYEFRIDEEFVNVRLAEFQEFERKSGYSFFKPDSDPELAFSYLKKAAIIPRERTGRLEVCWKSLKEKNPRLMLDAEPARGVVGPILIDPEIDIAEHSAAWWKNYYAEMDAYVADHPELQGRWDDWKKRIREWCFIGSDALGAIIAAPSGPAGAIVGGALGSLAFTIAWPPYA